MHNFFKIFTSMSAAEREQSDAHIERLIRAETERKKQTAFEKSGIGTKFFYERIETYQRCAQTEKALNVVTAYLQSLRCGAFKSLVLCGNPGTGKTHLAGGLLYELGGIFRLSDVIREEYEAAKSFTAKYTQAELIRRYGTAPFLVIDEVGRTESPVTANVEKHCLYRIINERYNNRLPTVFTSNLTQEGFITYLGKASMDRLIESADFCVFDWSSFRLKKRGA